MSEKKALSAWTKGERNFLAKLKSPEKIQHYLDIIPYNSDDQCRSPRRVLRDRKAHCMEGALFAAAALRFHGYGCRLMDMAAVRDDDHVIALFKQYGCWGGVAKSNFSGIRFREPVYRSLRELVMSYFENYLICGFYTSKGCSAAIFPASPFSMSLKDDQFPLSRNTIPRTHSTIVTQIPVIPPPPIVV